MFPLIFAPYVIRDPIGYWHTYNLERINNGQPAGVCLVIYLQPDEMIDNQLLVDALKSSLQPAPMGDWYRVNVAERVIRSMASQQAPVLITLVRNDRVQITEQVTAPPGKWGKVCATQHGTTIKYQEGWIYMGSMVKI